MPRHTVDIPAFIWEHFRERYQMNNPASYIREVLGEWVADDKVEQFRQRVLEAAASAASGRR
jgi:hypothetical protein